MTTVGAGKNGGGRQKQRQWRGQTPINQKAATIAAETAIVVATAATETAAAETATAAAPTVAKAATDTAAEAAECDVVPAARFKVGERHELRLLVLLTAAAIWMGRRP